MSKTLPWYKEGLRFGCTQCGKCCSGGPGYVWVDQEELNTIATFLHLTPEDFKNKYIRIIGKRMALKEKQSGDYDCLFLKDNLCRIYDVRPKQCRTFPWWKENLASKEKWEEAAKTCEGISNEAPLVSYEEISKLFH